jgi:hypothetical protein
MVTFALRLDPSVYHLQCIASLWVASLNKMGFQSFCEAQPTDINIYAGARAKVLLTAFGYVYPMCGQKIFLVTMYTYKGGEQSFTGTRV